MPGRQHLARFYATDAVDLPKGMDYFPHEQVVGLTHCPPRPGNTIQLAAIRIQCTAPGAASTSADKGRAVNAEAHRKKRQSRGQIHVTRGANYQQATCAPTGC